MVSGVIRVVGPVLGAIFLALFDLGPILWIDLITFCIALIPLIFIKIPSVMKKEEKEQKFSKQLIDGMRVLKETKGLISLLFAATLINFFFTPISTLLPMFVNKVHMGTQQDYAIVVSLLEAGVIAGSLLMTFFKGFKNKIQTAVIGINILFIGAALLIFIPTTLPSRFWLMGSILFVSIAPNPVANVSFITVMQILIPKDKMGRVMSFASILAMAITPIGTFLSGLIGEFVNLGVLFTTTSLIGLASFLLIYFLTPARHLDRRINERTTLKQNDVDKKADIKQKDFTIEPSEAIAKSITTD